MNSKGISRSLLSTDRRHHSDLSLPFLGDAHHAADHFHGSTSRLNCPWKEVRDRWFISFVFVTVVRVCRANSRKTNKSSRTVAQEPMSAKISSEREQICGCFLDSLSMVLAQHLYTTIRLQNRLHHASRQLASSCFDHDLLFSSSLRCSSDDCSFVHRSAKVSSLPSRSPRDCRSISRPVRDSLIDSQWSTINAIWAKRFSSILDRLLANPIHRWRNSCLKRNSSSVYSDSSFLCTLRMTQN